MIPCRLPLNPGGKPSPPREKSIFTLLPGPSQPIMSTLVDLKDLTQGEFEQLMVSWGQAPFRARQIQKWLYKGVTDFQTMTDHR